MIRIMIFFMDSKRYLKSIGKDLARRSEAKGPKLGGLTSRRWHPRGISKAFLQNSPAVLIALGRSVADRTGQSSSCRWAVGYPSKHVHGNNFGKPKNVEADSVLLLAWREWKSLNYRFAFRNGELRNCQGYRGKVWSELLSLYLLGISN